MLISFFLHFRQKYDNSSYQVIALTSSLVSHQRQWFYCCSNFDVIYQFFFLIIYSTLAFSASHLCLTKHRSSI